MIDIDRVKTESRGRWLGIFSNLGIDVPENKKHGACPICGPGRNSHRFRVSDKDGVGMWICTQCGAGDGIALIQKCLGITFIEAIKKISDILGFVEVDFKQNKPKQDPSIFLNKVWNNSAQLTGKDPVSLYLQTRGITIRPKNVRFCEKCYESATKKNLVAMVAAIHNKKGVKIGIHRTYLEGNGKSDIESPKKLMPPVEPLNGSAIRLSYPGDDCLGVSEGIESALSASQLFNIAVWACMSSSLLEAWEPPENIKKIIILGDNDFSFGGEKSAYTLAYKLYKKGYLVEVKIPNIVGQDFNDVLLEKRKNLC
jgi:putative DNA primase/helicase